VNGWGWPEAEGPLSGAQPIKADIKLEREGWCQMGVVGA